MFEDFTNFYALAGEDDPVKVLLVGETYCDRNFRIEREESDLMALEYIIDGNGELNINGQRLEPERGDVFFLKRGSRHSYSTDNSTPWHKYWIVFDGSVARAMADSYLPKDTYLFKNCSVKSHFERIFQLSKTVTEYSKLTDAVALELLHIFMYIRNRTAYDDGGVARSIRRELDASVEKPFNLDRLCQSVNYSKNYIINVFKEEYGVTPYRYFLEKKTDAAKIYLMHTNLSVGDIAKKLNYADLQYFSTSFKKATGCSPLEFRKRTRK